MEKVSFIEIESYGEVKCYAIIDHGNEEFSSMPKSIYDEMIKAQDEATVI